MRAIHTLLVCLLLPGFTLAQAKGQAASSQPASRADLASEVQALREALWQTQKQVAAQQAEIQTLKTQSKTVPMTPPTDNEVPTETEPITQGLPSHEIGETSAHGTLNIDQQLSAQQAQKKGQ